MKSRTFLNSFSGSKAKGQLWIPVFLAIGFFFAFPVAELIAMGNWNAYGYTAEKLAECYQNMWKDGFLATGAVIVLIAAFINGVNGYWYLFSSSKVDFYHCLPIKRSRMFTEKAVTGILYVLVPYIVMGFLAVCIGAMRGYFSLELMGLGIKMLLIHLMIYLLAYFGVVLAISLTGNLLMGAMMTGVVFFYGAILGVIIEAAKTSFFSTVTYVEKSIGETIGLYFSPVTLSALFINRYSTGKDVTKLLLIILGAIALLALASFVAYTRRPMEAAGKSIVYPFVKVIVEFMIVIPSGLSLGLIFHAITEGEKKEIWYITGLILGTILVHGMLQVIFHLDFRKFFGAKLQLLLTGAAVVFAAMVFQFDLFGYDAYIPKYDKLKKIEIENIGLLGMESSNQYIEKDESGKYHKNEIWCETGKSEKVYNTMKSIVSGQKQRRSDLIGTYRNSVVVKYTTTSGKVTARRYDVNRNELREILSACYDHGQLKEKKSSFLAVDTKYLKQVEGEFCSSEGNYTLFQGEKQKQEELVQALRQDFEEADTESFIGVPVVSLSFSYEQVPGIQEGDTFIYGHLLVYPEFKRTLAILKETGYPLSLDDLKIEHINAYAAGRDKEGYFRGEKWMIEDPQQIEEIKKGLVSSSFIPDWVDTEDRIVLEVKFEDNRWEKNMQLLKAEVPSFLTEFLEKEIGNMPQMSQGAEVAAVNDSEAWINMD